MNLHRAVGDRNLISATSTVDTTHDSKTTGGSIGVSFDIGGGKGKIARLTVDVSGKYQTEDRNSSRVKFTEILIKGSEGVSFASGGDTTLKGA